MEKFEALIKHLVKQSKKAGLLEQRNEELLHEINLLEKRIEQLEYEPIITTETQALSPEEKLINAVENQQWKDAYEELLKEFEAYKSQSIIMNVSSDYTQLERQNLELQGRIQALVETNKSLEENNKELISEVEAVRETVRLLTNCKKENP